MAAESDCINVTVPADSAHLHLLRLNAAGVAGTLDFSIEEIEDLKLAVEELCAWLIEQAAHSPLRVELLANEDGLRIEGWRDGIDGGHDDLDEFRASIVGAVVDRYEVTREGSRLGFRLQKIRV